jgi:hypothetical protein
MIEDINNLGNEKVDLVHFDLTAGSYELCVSMIHILLERHLTNDAIIVFDDMLPRHPKMLLFFQYLLRETNLKPVAFSTGKIAMMDSAHKDAFIQKARDAELVDPDNDKEPYFSFLVENVPNGWGDHLNLRAN